MAEITLIDWIALAMIRDGVARRGEAPTLKEISKAICCKSTRTAFETMNRLERAGLITRTRRWRSARPKKPLSIKVAAKREREARLSRQRERTNIGTILTAG